MAIKNWPRDAKLTVAGILVTAIMGVVVQLLSSTQWFGLTQNSSPQRVEVVGTATASPSPAIAVSPTGDAPISVQLSHNGEWVQNVTDAFTDATVNVLVTYRNIGRSVAKDVTVKLEWPSQLLFAEGSTVLRNGNYPNGYRFSGSPIISGGVGIGSYNPRIVAYVKSTGFVRRPPPVRTYYDVDPCRYHGKRRSRDD